MGLPIGSRVGPYEIVGAIGSGGMGDVYRARDARLGRDVAVKSLPPGATADPERVARFKREAQILAALNHPHIAAIYGLEDGPPTAAGPGGQYLILELALGGTLADRLAARTREPGSGADRAGGTARAIEMPDALRMSRQVADALEAAHEKGIIHRDLKPGNIALGAKGEVKVLDFGLAKAFAPDSDAPTELGATHVGVVLGTAAYMSPEQTRGQPLDKRTDIWAFGCVLFELLTGRHPFPGETRSDVIAAILERDPDWRELPAGTPPRVQWLVRRCLEKDVRNRLHDIADARIELDAALNPSIDSGGTAASRTDNPRRPVGIRERLAWATAALAVVALGATFVIGRVGSSTNTAADARLLRASVVLPDTLRLSAGNPPGRFALSPDGRLLAVVASTASSQVMLWIRPLDSGTARPLPGTEGASYPFWSPDSRFIGFLAQNKLKRVELSSGGVITLSDATLASTSTWNRDGVILFTPKASSPVYRISASGGTASPVTALDKESGDEQHSFPYFLPDGKHFLYFVVGTKAGSLITPSGVFLGSLDDGKTRTLVVKDGSNAKFANGQLTFMREGVLVSQPFDPVALTPSGEPKPVVEHVQVSGSASTGMSGAYTVSDANVLAYQTGFLVRSQLTWLDRSGTKLSNLGEQADHADVVLSPDGSRVATSILDPAIGSRDIWIYDRARGIGDRFTSGPTDDFAPVWSPDGASLAYSSQRQGRIDLYRRRSDGSGSEEMIPADTLGLGKFATHWSPDGQWLLYIGGGGIIRRSDLWVTRISGDRKAIPFVETEFLESNGRFSPDGQWIAYMSGHTGQPEVYVQPFPGPGTRLQVSAKGGGWPRWGREGREIIYLAPNNMLMSAAVTVQTTGIKIGEIRTLFPVELRPITRLDAYPYDVTADGKRFLVNALVEDSTLTAITLVVNWTKDR